LRGFRNFHIISATNLTFITEHKTSTMKKILVLFLTVLLLIIVILFGVRSYARQNLELDVVKCIEEINASLPEGQALTYEDIEPCFTLFCSEVRVKNPVLSSAVVIRHEGELIVGKSLWSNTYWAGQEGVTEIIRRDDTGTFKITSPWTLTAECKKREGKCPITWENCIAYMKNISLSIGKGKVVMAKDEEVDLGTLDRICLTLVETEAEEMTQTYSTSLKIENLDLPGLNEKRLTDWNLRWTSPRMYPNEYGVMNSCLQGSVKVPTPKALEKMMKTFQENPFALIDEATSSGYGFEFTAAGSQRFSSATGCYRLTGSQKEEKPHARLFMDAETRFSDHYSDLLKQIVGRLDREVPKTQSGEELKLFLAEKKEAIKALIGNFGDGAEATLQIDLSLQWNENLFLDQAGILVDFLEKTSRYGFKLEGEMDSLLGLDPTAGTYHFTIRRAMDTVDNLAWVYRQFAEMYLDVFPDKEVHILTDQEIARMKKMLKVFADNPDAVDLEISIDTTEPGNPKIGGKPLVELMTQLQDNPSSNTLDPE